MRFAKPLEHTFRNHLQHVHYAQEAAEEQHIKKIIQNFRQLDLAGPAAMTSWYYVIDYSRSQYLLMSDGIKLVTDYDPRDFLDGGLAMLIDVYQKDDFKLYNEQVFPANTAFLKTIDKKEQDDHVFSYTFRVHDRQKKTIHLLQRGSYITSQQTGLPLYSLGMVTDVTPIKKDLVMLHRIEKASRQPGQYGLTPVAENFFYPDIDQARLTKQERNVLNYMTEGLSSKQVAAKLFISESTVVNHRKNMLKKTNTKNVAELVTFAIRNQLI